MVGCAINLESRSGEQLQLSVKKALFRPQQSYGTLLLQRR